MFLAVWRLGTVGEHLRRNGKGRWNNARAGHVPFLSPKLTRGTPVLTILLIVLLILLLGGGGYYGYNTWGGPV